MIMPDGKEIPNDLFVTYAGSLDLLDTIFNCIEPAKMDNQIWELYLDLNKNRMVLRERLIKIMGYSNDRDKFDDDFYLIYAQFKKGAEE